MTKFAACNRACAVFLFCSATTIVLPAQTFTKLADFNGNNGNAPPAPLIQGTDGNLYGVTAFGGTESQGVLFRLTPGASLKSLSLTGVEDNPFGGLLQATDGNAYGTTLSGGNPDCDPAGCGTVFRVTPQHALTTLHSFCEAPGCTDGMGPIGGLVQGPDGLYGLAFRGGNLNCFAPLGCGTVFKIGFDGMLTTLYTFLDQNDGWSPQGPLVLGTDRNLYGITEFGGNHACIPPNGCGTVFKLTPRGTLTTLHAFSGTDGCAPTAGLMQGADGNFYGTTQGGGPGGCQFGGGPGTIFRITPEGVLTTLHAFQYADGANPSSVLLQATDGNFYGTSEAGGANDRGTIFKITPDGVLATVHAFDGVDGRLPVAGLLQSTQGTFYGSTYAGGVDDMGTLFNLDVGLGPFVAFVRSYGKVGQTGGILGQGFTGTTAVTLNGTPASFTVVSDTYLKATVPPGATTGYVTVSTPSGSLTSNVPFTVMP